MTENTVAPVDPARTALLLMDIQPTAVTTLAEPQTLLARANDALTWARAKQIQICFVRVGFAEEDYPAIPAHSKVFAPVAQHRLGHADSPETQIHPSLEVRDEDIVVRKTRFGAFSTTDLHTQLRDKDIDTLILGGISTAGVVLSTLRDAGDSDYRVYVLADVTADHDPEVHRVLTEKVFPVQAHVITTADLPELAL